MTSEERRVERCHSAFPCAASAFDLPPANSGEFPDRIVFFLNEQQTRKRGGTASRYREAAAMS